MRRYETIFPSVNTRAYAKPITALVMEPDPPPRRPGAMLVTHGWGGNRFQYEQQMAWAAERLGLVCVAPEFRQSGLDHDAARGCGWDVPYDLSFYQVFDVLGALRHVLTLRPGIDRRRLFHYGGSQGGHIALLGAAFAPRTFAMVYAASPVTHVWDGGAALTGRTFRPWEVSVRNAIAHADAIRCPVLLEHGTADEIVDCDAHARPLVRRLRQLGRDVRVRYYRGGGHSLAPVATRFDTFRRRAPRAVRSCRLAGQDDWAAGRTVRIPCGERTLVIDWSQPNESLDLFRWVE